MGLRDALNIIFDGDRTAMAFFSYEEDEKPRVDFEYFYTYEEGVLSAQPMVNLRMFMALLQFSNSQFDEVAFSMKLGGEGTISEFFVCEWVSDPSIGLSATFYNH